MIPTQLGRYRILKKLAAGGMGEVFLARQEGPAGFSRPAVVKRILGHLAADPGFVQMFLAEARLAAVLSHPNVVQIFELGEADGTWFIAMEFLDGRSLRALGARTAKNHERVNPVQAARILGQALEGLHYAHQLRGDDGQPLDIVHRDVSPDNVFVGFNGVVKVLDFGIAKVSNAIVTTRAGELKGKFAYMAPEQVLARPLDGRTDVYAAGVVLYELLAGERPFGELSDAAMTYHIACVPPPPLAARAPQAPPELCALVMRALEKDPAQRWQSAEAFSQALEDFVRSTGEAPNNAATGAYLKLLFAADAEPDHSFATPAPAPVTAPPLTRAENSPDEPPLTRTEAFSPAGEMTWAQPEGSSGPLELAPPAPPLVEPALAPAPPAPTGQPVPPAELASAAASLHAVEPRANPSRWWVWPAVFLGLALAGVGAIQARRWAGSQRIEVANLLITSEPQGATLRIGDDVVGKTPWAGSNLWSGEVKYEVSLPGHQSKRGTFSGGRDVELSVSLPKLKQK